MAMSVIHETMAFPLRKARLVNATDAAFPSRIPMATEPQLDDGTATGQAAIDILPRGHGNSGAVQNAIKIVPIGTGGDNDTFNLRAIGWTLIGTDPATDQWLPIILAEFVCTMCAAVGVAGTQVLATERYCDTIVLTIGNPDVNVRITAPTADLIAHILLDLEGSLKFEPTFDATAAGTTGMNCLVGLM